MGEGEVLDPDWVPELQQLRQVWELVVKDDSHLWNAPF